MTPTPLSQVKHQACRCCTMNWNHRTLLRHGRCLLTENFKASNRDHTNWCLSHKHLVKSDHLLGCFHKDGSFQSLIFDRCHPRNTTVSKGVSSVSFESLSPAHWMLATHIALPTVGRVGSPSQSSTGAFFFFSGKRQNQERQCKVQINGKHTK